MSFKSELQCRIIPVDHAYSLRTMSALRTYGSDQETLKKEFVDFKVFPFASLAQDNEEKMEKRCRAYLEAILNPQPLFAAINAKLVQNTSSLLCNHAYELAVDLAKQHPHDIKLTTLVHEEKSPLKQPWQMQCKAKKILQKHLRTLPEFNANKDGPLNYARDFTQRHKCRDDFDDYMRDSGIALLNENFFPASQQLIRQSWKNPSRDQHVTATDVIDNKLLQQGKAQAIASDVKRFIYEIRQERMKFLERFKLDNTTPRLPAPLTRKEAEQKIKDMVATFPDTGVGSTLARITLKTPDVTLAVSSLPEIFPSMTTNFYDEAAGLYK